MSLACQVCKFDLLSNIKLNRHLVIHTSGFSSLGRAPDVGYTIFLPNFFTNNHAVKSTSDTISGGTVVRSQLLTNQLVQSA